MSARDEPNKTVKAITAKDPIKRLEQLMRRHGQKVLPLHAKCKPPELGKWKPCKGQMSLFEKGDDGK